MKKILIIRTDNSKQELTYEKLDFVAELGNHKPIDITDAITLWVRNDKVSENYNLVANRIHNEYRGINDDFLYGDVIFTGKATLSEIAGLDENAEKLILGYLPTKETN
jgi:hypothetical protein